MLFGNCLGRSVPASTTPVNEKLFDIYLFAALKTLQIDLIVIRFIISET